MGDGTTTDNSADALLTQAVEKGDVKQARKLIEESFWLAQPLRPGESFTLE